MNADVRRILAEFGFSFGDDQEADRALTPLRAASRAWHTAVVAAIRFYGPAERGGTITTFRART